MPDFNEVLTQPDWLPHSYDAGSGQVAFALIDEQARDELTFLADFKPTSNDQVQWVPADTLGSVAPEARPLHFLFHSAFCRSTLLVQALGALEQFGSLSEPAILNSLQSHASNPQAIALVPALLGQLGKPMASEHLVIAKPSNFANGLIPTLLDHASGTKGILLFGGLAAFLRSVAKKGLAGRIWARKLLAHNRQIMPLDLGMDEKAHFELTDLQCAALAWLLQMQQFTQLAKARPDALQTLDSERFIANKAGTILACARWYGIEARADQAQAIADGPLFSSHAKQGGDYQAVKAEQDAAGTSQVTEEEIAQIEQWIGVIMQQLGLTLPLPNPLKIAGE